MLNLLFDYDGTLHDSLKIYLPAVQAAADRLAARGYAPPCRLTAGQVREWIGLPPAEMWERFLPGLPEEEKQQSIRLVGQRMQQLTEAGRARLYEGVPEVLAALKGQGMRLLLLSNCSVEYLETHIRQFELERYFEGCFCAEGFGYRPKYEIYPQLCRLYDGPFLVIGDRAQDIEMAQRNALPSIGCRYGYGNPEELEAASLWAASPWDLPGCIRRLSGQKRCSPARL